MKTKNVIFVLSLLSTLSLCSCSIINNNKEQHEEDEDGFLGGS